MSFLPDSEDIIALKELINSPGFVVGACLINLGILVYFLVIPIPSKLDELIIAVKSNCSQGVAYEIIRSDRISKVPR